MGEIIQLICPQCGNRQTTESPCPFTGWEYNEGWVLKCEHCNETLKRFEEGQDTHPAYVCECEKVLNEYVKMNPMAPFRIHEIKSCKYCDRRTDDFYCYRLAKSLPVGMLEGYVALKTTETFGCIHWKERRK
jgi:hypothetical protein